MIDYDYLDPLEKLKIYDARVDSPPHYNSFSEHTYSYHYGDIYIPYVKQEEPLKVECQHFLDCINTGALPISNGHAGMELVKILEASNESLIQRGAEVFLEGHQPKPVIQIRSAVPVAAQSVRRGVAPVRNGNGNGNGNGRHKRPSAASI